MNAAAVAIVTALLIEAPVPAPLTQHEFEQLISEAALARAQTAPTKRVCLVAELDPPLDLSKSIAKSTGMPQERSLSPSSIKYPGLFQAFLRALSGNATVVPQTRIGAAPAPLILVRTGAEVPAECVQPPPRHMWSPKDPSTLRISRPVISGGYAFIDSLVTCPGLCGNGGLLIFRKMQGHWKQIDVTWVTIQI